MLYPDLDELIALKSHKLKLKELSRKSAGAVLGNYGSAFRGQGLEFDAVREYVFGDDIRSIDWKVTARIGSPHVKIFREERERTLFICLDMNAQMRFGTKNTFKSVMAAKTAALLGWQGIYAQDKVSAYLYGDVPGRIQYFPPTKTRKSFSSLLKMLTEKPKEQHAVPLEDVLNKVNQTAKSGSLIYIISDFLEAFPSDRILTALTQKNDVVFISVNDQADGFLAPIGMLGFSDDELFITDTDHQEGRERYQAFWQKNRKELSEWSTRLKIPIIELTTESDVRKDLILALKLIARGHRR